MFNKNIRIGLALLCLFLPSIVSAHSDGCHVHGYGGYCYFNSLSRDHNKHLYFHCDTQRGNLLVKLTNHHVLITGHISGRGPAAGTLTLSGLIDVKSALDHYYFEVQDDSHHSGTKYVFIASMGRIHCELGRGGRTSVFPGLFG